ncbi:CLUMA_CG017101, isoform A [Clunio marinus]|uniref:CLUMA_CG017101, isoform A n=1 Tax=Clunio marinus TaxID=568069 RepID=A0A1J1IXU9_9DIPT|nr:CLUMA_CG017101, isoform A [Clunio marinus]
MILCSVTNFFHFFCLTSCSDITSAANETELLGLQTIYTTQSSASYQRDSTPFNLFIPLRTFNAHLFKAKLFPHVQFTDFS